MTNDGTVVLHGFNDAPQIVETVPIVVMAMREHGQGYKKFGSLKENFFFQEMKIEEKRRDEEWDRLMTTQAEIADSYQREIDRKKA